MSTFAIVSNISNGAGLQKDYELLKGILEAAGHTVYGEMFNAVCPTRRVVDVVIFLEVLDPRWMGFGRQIWMVPNTEWWYGSCWDFHVRSFTKVLCKTKDCYALWDQKAPSKCTFTGWEAADLYRPEIERKPMFLHLAGKSETKNTAAVMAAWRDYRIQYPLIVSAFKPEIVNLTRNVRNVTQVDRFPDVVQVMNECRFHIMPSKNEGFGHAIHEALGCGGVVLTTNAPPMNEFSGIHKPLLIDAWRKEKRLTMSTFNMVESSTVAAAVSRAVQLYPDQLQQIADDARAGFLADRQHFRDTFAELLAQTQQELSQ